MKYNEILHGPALEQLKTLESDTVDCCITSPPYWSLRDYKTEGQLGLEPTFQEYITKLIDIFNQVKRVLKKSGSCWVNLGDTYAGSGGAGGDYNEGGLKEGQPRYKQNKPSSISHKSLCGIPARFQIAMIDRGWICRNTIIWFKPNCMPNSAKDRFTVDFEYLFFFTKSEKYYFETQYEPCLDPQDDIRRALKTSEYNRKKSYFDEHYHNNKQTEEQVRAQVALGRIKRCVWKIATQPFSEAHFATFPPALVKTPLLATCPVEGLVLDPFAGAGTVALVAMQNARNFVGIELNEEYIKMAMERLKPYLLQTRLV